MRTSRGSSTNDGERLIYLEGVALAAGRPTQLVGVEVCQEPEAITDLPISGSRPDRRGARSIPA